MVRFVCLLLSGLTVLAVAAAATVVLLPPPSWDFWQYGLIVLEFALVPAAVAALGALLALAGRAARPRAAAVLAAVNAVALAAALVPPATTWWAARQAGAPVSLGGYADGLATSADREPLTLVYASPGGEDLEMDVWRPREPADGPLPVVVNVHGGAEDLPQSLLPRWDTWLADRGHVVFEVDYRFFPDGDGTAAVADVRCALGRIREDAAGYGGDPDRIVLTGQSAGGLLALLAAYTPAGDIPPSCPVEHVPVAAVAAWYSVADGTADAPPYPWRLRSSPLAAQLDQEGERMTDGDPEVYAAMSPLHRVSPDAPPTLLITAGHDLFLDPGDNRRLAARLAEAGVEHRLVEIPWAEHMFDLNWGGLASQWARHELSVFLGRHTG
ncbi:alpha/beta hydrolase [Nocardiopsis changdeensis]|uniref:Alpha/beta hydrolase n=1 Tax=Nocardiopsis changdeensis TaxID=2831969 RepID=A0ABX8BRS4_9ACTN|nr:MULTISPECIES: alpha/beta hydrolase [Nocardiopsis]QUX24789.1 alpha/beta hydrolase [Nocardiopsis changdeensis]QYX35176.1 alpha/beta hydrolase [Nocardiopsis sp. MT53]